jgi:hypothetical protein
LISPPFFSIFDGLFDNYRIYYSDGISPLNTAVYSSFFNLQAFPQIVFKSFPDYKISIDSSFFDINSRRSIVLLNGDWMIYTPKEKQNQKKIFVPSVFSGEGELIFERTFNFTSDQLSRKQDGNTTFWVLTILQIFP